MENRLCDLQVFSNLSNCNYCIFVQEILLEIGFIKSFFSIQIGPLLDHIICSILVQKKLDHVRKKSPIFIRATTKRHKGNLVSSTKLK